MTTSRRRAPATRRTPPAAARARHRWALPGPAMLASALVLIAVVGWVDQALRGAL